jgi:hypothetical protein
MLSLFSSRWNWHSPTPRMCPTPPPLVPGGGAHSPEGEGVGGSQFRRGDIHCGTLGIYVCTLCAMAIVADVKGTLTLRSRMRKSLNVYVKEAAQSKKLARRRLDRNEHVSYFLLCFLLPVCQLNAPQFYLTGKEGEGGGRKAN